MKNSKIIKNILKWIVIISVVIGRSFVTYVFQIPNGFAPGGVSGIATIAYNIIEIVAPNNKILSEIFNPSIVIFVLNIPLLILAYKFVNKKYTLATFFAVIVYAGIIKIFEITDIPQFTAAGLEGVGGQDIGSFVSTAGIKTLAAVMGGVLDGFCLGMLIRLNASAGGTEIISMIVCKRKPNLNIAWILFIMDFSIAFCSGLIGIATIVTTNVMSPTEMLVRIATPIMYSCIALFLSSKIADYVNTGMDTSLVFNIVTSKPEEICNAIFEKIHRGATILNGEGAYTKDEKKIIVCIVNKKQSIELKKIAKNIDDNSFTYIMRASEVRGKGFDKNGSN